ncbi:MAG: serine/threonine protein kinase [Planctomycetaceae bacterium]|nr:serine/threonine protein kinase [Planctomycetaceae bacterium]
MAYPFDSSAFDADIRGMPRREAIGPAGPELLDTLISRFLEDLRDGRSPSVEALVQRHPALAAQLRELLPMVAAMEQLKSTQEMTPRKVEIPKDFRLERLGDCRMLREIGRGGMGIVYEAEQAPTGRHVAVKVLPWRSDGSSQWRAHFEREARTAASLHHPHIVPVYHYDEEDGWSYYVMHLVEGIGIDEIIRLLREPAGSVGAEQVRQIFLGEAAGEDRPRTPARASADQQARILRRDGWTQFARIGIQVAQALQYSHSRGILHRDIKPGNLLVDCRGSVWVTDFGLAVETDQMLESTAPNLAGTLRYLAPEQLDGIVDRRSDIYSLGVTLYELCTLRPLYEASSRDGLVVSIRSETPATPRSINREVPRDLEAIILRAISRDRGRRYVSAEALMTDLMRFVRRQPVEPAEPEKSKRWTPFR